VATRETDAPVETPAARRCVPVRTCPALRSRLPGIVLGLGLLVALTTLVESFASAEDRAIARPLPVQHRRPAAAELSADGRTLYVASRRSGSISLIDTETGQVREQPIGQQLSDLVRLPGSSELLAVDHAGASLILLTPEEGILKIRHRTPVALWPVAAAVDSAGQWCCVASLWSRRLTIVPLADQGEPLPGTVTHMVDLPFAARAVAFIAPHTVAVADAFGGRLAVVDIPRRRITRLLNLPVHGIRSMAVDGTQSLYLTCQRLDPHARTEREHIHWGVLIQNEIAVLPLADLTAEPRDSGDPGDAFDLRTLSRIPLGEPGHGAGDPEGLVLLPDRILVTLAGTDELALVDRVGVREIRIPVGHRPADLVVDHNRQRAFVVDSLSDSVSIVNLDRVTPPRRIQLGPAPQAGAVERGERAFFSARHSLEGWMSCHSCHTDGHTSNTLSDTLGDGGFGSAKRVPSLLGTWSTGPWAWNGSLPTLHGQITQSLTSSMHGPQVNESLIQDLVAYVTSLEGPPSLASSRPGMITEVASERGLARFESSGCLRCHDRATGWTTHGIFDVGLSDTAGQSRFNPPSLRGVSQRDRLLHAGQAKQLSEVFSRFSHPPDQSLTDSQISDLTSYLLGL